MLAHIYKYGTYFVVNDYRWRPNNLYTYLLSDADLQSYWKIEDPGDYPGAPYGYIILGKEKSSNPFPTTYNIWLKI